MRKWDKGEAMLSCLAGVTVIVVGTLYTYTDNTVGQRYVLVIHGPECKLTGKRVFAICLSGKAYGTGMSVKRNTA